MVLGRRSPPPSADASNIVPLGSTSLLNGGYQNISSSTSPILSQGAGKCFHIIVLLQFQR